MFLTKDQRKRKARLIKAQTEQRNAIDAERKLLSDRAQRDAWAQQAHAPTQAIPHSKRGSPSDGDNGVTGAAAVVAGGVGGGAKRPRTVASIFDRSAQPTGADASGDGDGGGTGRRSDRSLWKAMPAPFPVCHHHHRAAAAAAELLSSSPALTSSASSGEGGAAVVSAPARVCDGVFLTPCGEDKSAARAAALSLSSPEMTVGAVELSAGRARTGERAAVIVEGGGVSSSSLLSSPDLDVTLRTAENMGAHAACSACLSDGVGALPLRLCPSGLPALTAVEQRCSSTTTNKGVREKTRGERGVAGEEKVGLVKGL